MRPHKIFPALLPLLLAACASKSSLPPTPKHANAEAVSPAFADNTSTLLFGEIWTRPGLTPRQRSLVTIAALIARGDTVEMPYHFELALHNGVKPIELSETINHLAFYSGWGRANNTILIAQEVFSKHGITPAELAPVSPTLLPINEEEEKNRSERVKASVGPVSEGLEQYTETALFRNLWLRPGLAPQDRSLITVSALVAAGQVNQINYHLNRAMSYGLSKTEAGEVLTQLAFYAGWPSAFSAVPEFKKVFEARQANADKGGK